MITGRGESSRLVLKHPSRAFHPLEKASEARISRTDTRKQCFIAAICSVFRLFFVVFRLFCHICEHLEK